MNNELRFLKGSKANFSNLPSKTEDNFYITTGASETDYCLYLGNRLLAKCGSESAAIEEAKKYIDSLKEQLDTQISNIDKKIDGEISRSTVKDDEIDKKIKKNAVSSSNKTLVVSSSDNGTDLKVNIDNTTLIQQGGVISVSNDSLAKYDGKDSVVVENGENGNKIISLKINTNDNILTQNAAGLLSNLKILWSAEKGLELIGKDNTVISSVPSSQLIIDGLLKDVILKQTQDGTFLVFTFKTTYEGEKVIEVNVADLIDVYLGVDGIEVNGKEISIKIDKTSAEQYLKSTAEGLKTEGIKADIDASRTEVKASTDDPHINVNVVTSSTKNIYTISSNDIASKTALESHTTNQDIHVELSDKTKWDKLITDLETEIGERKTAISGEAEARTNKDNSIIGSVGLEADGTYKKTNGNYTSGATKITEEISALDTELKTANDSLTALNSSLSETKAALTKEEEARKALKGSGNINVFSDIATSKQTIRLEWGTF